MAGAFTPLAVSATVVAHNGPVSLAMVEGHGAGNLHAYVAGGDDFSAFAIDTGTGALTAVRRRQPVRRGRGLILRHRPGYGGVEGINESDSLIENPA